MLPTGHICLPAVIIRVGRHHQRDDNHHDDADEEQVAPVIYYTPSLP